MATLADRGADLAAYRAVGTLYNALMTALILGLVTRRGEEVARDYVFRHSAASISRSSCLACRSSGWRASPTRRPARSITTIPTRSVA